MYWAKQRALSPPSAQLAGDRAARRRHRVKLGSVAPAFRSPTATCFCAATRRRRGTGAQTAALELSRRCCLAPWIGGLGDGRSVSELLGDEIYIVLFDDALHPGKDVAGDGEPTRVRAHQLDLQPNRDEQAGVKIDGAAAVRARA